jgi:hypothetical protein
MKHAWMLVSGAIGGHGPEHGIILRDEIHPEGGHITLESGGYTAPYSITCGISGWLVDTIAFESLEAAESAFDHIRTDLDRIMRLIPSGERMNRQTEHHILTAIGQFIQGHLSHEA